MKILITGINGFIGRNLSVACGELGHTVVGFGKKNHDDDLLDLLQGVEAVVHLAGVNRADDDREFYKGNVDLTGHIIATLENLTDGGKVPPIPILFSSSIHAPRDDIYGRTKLACEDMLAGYSQRTGASVGICRLPGVFGKWAQPNYNSVVATFCHNIANRLPIRNDAPHKRIDLVYIDDVVAEFVRWVESVRAPGVSWCSVSPVFNRSLSEIEYLVEDFRNSSNSKQPGNVGSGFDRALYSTYLSYLPKEEFSYPLVQHEDSRGVFVEVLRTPNAGQFSFFTAAPGVTRGGHYHHTKTEKFIVVSGQARFRFRNIVTGEFYEVHTNDKQYAVVDTIPGWSHDVTNTGDQDLICMLWANEKFDPDKPDTVGAEI